MGTWYVFIVALLTFTVNCRAELRKPDLIANAREALMSYDIVEERAEYFIFKIKKLTFGDYTDQVLILSPLITGNFEFHAMKMKFYYNYNKRRAGVKYDIHF